MKRKGSMQLSIEAIIILVIAFTLLGFGIKFVRDIFEDAGGNTRGALQGDACDRASSTKPFNPETIKVSKGKTQETNLCVFNNAGDEIKDGTIKIQNCKDPAGNIVNMITPTAPVPLNVSSLGQDIPRGEGRTYAITVNAANAEIGTYICNVFVQNATTTSTKVGPRQLKFEVQ